MQKSLNWLLLGVASLLLLILGQAYGTRYHLAWIDETWFMEMAEHFADHRSLATPTFEGNGFNMSERIYGVPPVYPLCLSAWFNIAPRTLESARLFSNLAAVLCLLGLFGLARRLQVRGVIPGLLTLALAVDVQFAAMYNFARPDILACAFSILAIWTYFTSIDETGHRSLGRLALAWLLANAGMLTHPIGGAIGFMVIPLHLLLTAPRQLRRVSLWAICIGITLAALSLWGLYLVRDLETFRYQFIDFQLERKAGRFAGATAYLRLAVEVLTNYGIKGDELAGVISTLFLILVGIKSFSEKDRRHPALVVLLMILVSGFVVQYGREMPYPPLRLPAFYLALALCLDTPLRFAFAKIEQGVLFCRYSVLAGLAALLVVASSTAGTLRLLKEVRRSERAAGYAPTTLAQQIVNSIPAGATIGFRAFPDCVDVLVHSKHFRAVHRLAWSHLTNDELVRYICRNDYLIISDSALDPRYSHQPLDFCDPAWGANKYRAIAQQHYTTVKTIVLPGGGTTKIYRRMERPASSALEKTSP